jgi:hypothetical protein
MGMLFETSVRREREPGEFIFQFTHDATSLSEIRVYLRWCLLFLMAMARAFFVPIRMTSGF